MPSCAGFILIEISTQLSALRVIAGMLVQRFGSEALPKGSLSHKFNVSAGAGVVE